MKSGVSSVESGTRLEDSEMRRVDDEVFGFERLEVWQKAES